MCATFIISEKEKPPGNKFVGQDLNFYTVNSTTACIFAELNRPVLKSVETRSIKNIAHIQNDFSRRRKQIQKHVHNRQKNCRKLKRTRGRQRNRVNDALQKLPTEVARANQTASFVFEKLKGIREGATGRREESSGPC
ncbi:MAG: hypothetical protein JRN53_04420 [Nitrososphaerota archaeon]|nr:hypothetical protein [Nitrososphaerota archaeon]